MSNKTQFPTEGVELTQLLVVSMEKSKWFYRDVLGAELFREYGGTSCVLKFQGCWLLLVTGGDPTEDKPDVIGIGGSLTASPLPHHLAYGSRTTAVRLDELTIFGQPDFQVDLPKYHNRSIHSAAGRLNVYSRSVLLVHQLTPTIRVPFRPSAQGLMATG